jgi:hypothetical protein
MITSGGGGFSLGAGQEKTIKVKFCPTSAGSKTATLYASGTNCNDDSSSLSGTGEAIPAIELTPSGYSFGTVEVDQCSSEYSFTLTNTGGGTATGSVSLTGAHANQFTITSGGGGFSLGAGQEKTIKVKFCPTSAGSKTATLNASGTNCNDASSSLSGGVEAAPAIELAPMSYNFGTIEVGQCSSEYSFTLYNTGGGTATGSVSLTAAHANQFTITSGGGSFSLGAGQEKTIKVTFCPTSAGSKSATLNAVGTNCNDDSSTLSGIGADEEPPLISNVMSSAITQTTATITWDTDEAADSRVKYGTTSGGPYDEAYDGADVTSHSMALTGLSANTTYYYVVNSTDPSGNIAESDEYSFKTLEAGALPRWDINQDGVVDDLDLGLLLLHYGETTSPPYPRWDVNEDGVVDDLDLGFLLLHYGEGE